MIVDPFIALGQSMSNTSNDAVKKQQLEQQNVVTTNNLSSAKISSSSKATSSNEIRREQGHEVESIVASLANKKKNDLDCLRRHLQDDQQPHEGTVQSNGRKSVVAPRPFFLQEPVEKNNDKKSNANARLVVTAPPVPKVPARWKILRCALLDVPLMLLFLSLAMVHFMRVCWTHYYLPIMQRARRTDNQLLVEYTYYERACTSEDITQDFKVNTINTTAQEALDTLMVHGATTVPQLLTPPTIAKLRQYLQHKNQIITDEEAIPMSQPFQRLSYALEPTEDEAISTALAEVTSHAFLRELLEQVLGVPDPALTELTAITAFYGAEDQVIHSDTKSDGYAGQFARTYTHTYSLFIPVQHITEKMGVTQLCPGTHYCTNDLQDVCEQHMFGVNQIFDDHVWKAGDGVLINQQVWHGGSQHTDRINKERTLFIVSFAARPQLGKDTRQLARGTYFHMKWNQWGHTFLDIATDSAISTSWPFNILRSLAIWKPTTRNWGYDLLLSAALRAANGQNGMGTEDLETFIDLKMNRLFHIPQWLQGSFSHRHHAWETYIQETLDKTFLFLQKVNAITLSVYLIVALVITLVATSRSSTGQLLGLKSSVGRLMVTHGGVALITWATLTRIETSHWGSNIRKGLTFRRPFPIDDEFTSTRWQADPGIPAGPTSFPERMDVLWGTRYDAPYLGSYNQWLDYHPGNRILKASVASRAHLYPLYNTNDKYQTPVFLQRLIHDIVNEVEDQTNGGRFLEQDHLSGDWVVLSKVGAMEKIRETLAAESNMILKKLNKQINFLVAEFRFAAHRGTALALESTLHLEEIRKRILQTTHSLFPVIRPGSSSLLQIKTNTSKKQLKLGLQQQSMLQQPKTVRKLPLTPSRVPFDRYKTAAKEPTVGSLVMVFDTLAKGWYKAKIVAEDRDRLAFDVVYAYDGTYEENVDIRRIRKRVSLQENLRVDAIMEDGLTYQGTIAMVYPSGNVDIMFDDGELIESVPREDVSIHYPPW